MEESREETSQGCCYTYSWRSQSCSAPPSVSVCLSHTAVKHCCCYVSPHSLHSNAFCGQIRSPGVTGSVSNFLPSPRPKKQAFSKPKQMKTKWISSCHWPLFVSEHLCEITQIVFMIFFFFKAVCSQWTQASHGQPELTVCWPLR